jgi:hypothetical protein
MHLCKNLILQNIDIMMFNEVGYFQPDDNKLLSLRSSDMFDPPSHFRDIQNKKLKNYKFSYLYTI